MKKNNNTIKTRRKRLKNSLKRKLQHRLISGNTIFFLFKYKATPPHSVGKLPAPLPALDGAIGGGDLHNVHSVGNQLPLDI